MTKSDLQVEALRTYLQPLVKKHEAGQELMHEDLMASWHAVEALLLAQQSQKSSSLDDVAAVVGYYERVKKMDEIMFLF